MLRVLVSHIIQWSKVSKVSRVSTVAEFVELGRLEKVVRFTRDRLYVVRIPPEEGSVGDAHGDAGLNIRILGVHLLHGQEVGHTPERHLLEIEIALE
jgi:hypothetical protein